MRLSMSELSAIPSGVLLIEYIPLHVTATSFVDLGEGKAFGSGALYQDFRLIVEIGFVVIQARRANDFRYSII